MSARRSGPTPNHRPAGDDDNSSAAARTLSRAIERGSRAQRPAVRAYIDHLRTANPGAAPTDVVAKLEQRYLRAVVTSGAAVGAMAALPAIGTLAALSVVAGETLLFLEATAIYVLGVAEVYDVPAEHREQRRTLVLAVLVGEGGKRAVADLVGPGRTNGAWLSEGAVSLPLPAVAELNTRMTRYFVKRYTLRRSALAIGKLLPVGIGAVIGGMGNRMMGKKMIDNAGKAFGAPPTRWPVTLHLLPTARKSG